MKSVLITGGAGYIGSQISYDLSTRGYKTYIVDNLSKGYKKFINPKSKFFKINISNKKKIRSIIKKYNIKNIVHCAAFISVEESEKQKKKYYKNNVVGTKKLLEASKGLIDNFIFSSTCAVYDVSKNFYVSEKTKTNPKSYYGKTKLICENLIKNYAKKNKFDYGILRYFNVAGSDSNMRSGCLNNYNALIKNLSTSVIKKNFFINVYGNNYKTKDGTCIRDYIHVSDLSLFHIKLLELMKKKNKSLILNCGYGKGYTVLDVIKCFEKVTKKKFNIIFKKRRPKDISKIIAKTTHFKKQIGRFEFKTLEDIVKSSLKWEKKNCLTKI